MELAGRYIDHPNLSVVGVRFDVKRQQMPSVGRPHQIRFPNSRALEAVLRWGRDRCQLLRGEIEYLEGILGLRPGSADPCKPAAVRRPHWRLKLFSGRVDYLAVASVFIGDMDLGELVLAVWGPPQVGEAAAVGRKTDNAVNVVDQLPGRTAKDRHDVQRTYRVVLRCSAGKVEIIAVRRKGEANVFVGEGAKNLGVGVRGNVALPQRPLAFVVLYLGQKASVCGERDSFDGPNIGDLVDGNLLERLRPGPEAPRGK